MSNVELARFMCAAMWHLACMVMWAQRGNTDRMINAEDEFRELLDSLDRLEKGSEE